MTRDPILHEVREARERHAALFGYDLRAIFADLKRTERRRNAKLIEPPPQGETPLYEARLRVSRRHAPPGSEGRPSSRHVSPG